ncbi:MAG: asparagine synthase (glutamine-hydrolyzing) [Alphaproteobacteria bacterium]|nr:asparagine synthase (glutamine-hydrolyzing) [Alphaproteobacteria bacterium]
MCGIAGTVDLRGLDRERAAAALARANARLAPRGPDGEGTWIAEHAAFTHRRLAVIALGADGAQPMHGHGLVVTYNGEIYNHADLRRELEAKGRRFATGSDTEVLLAGWAEWGPALLDRLVGMFAFALWDEARRELVLVRDRFGKKPLLYAVDGTRLAFASDFLALEHAADRRFALDRTALGWLFALRWLPDHVCIGTGAAKLPPGHFLRFSEAGTRIERWYDLAAARRTPLDDRSRARSRLVESFDAAVRDRLVSDVPVGAFLSSGLDSALVVASMARSGARVRSFTVGFDDAAFFDEREGARSVARHLGTEHVELSIATAEAPALLDGVVRGLDEPFADASAVPSYAVARAMRAHVTVALSGDGADEILGGYRKYQGEALAARWLAIPWPVRKLVTAVLARLPESRSGGLLEKLRRARRFAAGGDLDPSARHAAWMQDVRDDELFDLLPASEWREDNVAQLVADIRAGSGESDTLNLALATDIALTLPGDMLVKVDRTSMANALEVRSPFLDQRVVEAAVAMPGAFKVADGVGKKILREAFADRLPAEVFTRPKRGFELPVAAWLAGPLRAALEEAVEPHRLLRQGLVAPAVVARWRADLAANRRDTSWHLWTLMMLQRWLALHERPEAA